jgi:tetratricopeptide (TPR) repeat protein
MMRRLAMVAFAAWTAWAQTGEIQANYAKLKEAEGKSDADGVLEWAVKTSEAARAVVAKPQPTEADALEQWKKDVDYARQVDVYTEYSLMATSLTNPGPAKVVALVEALEKRNPKSQYLGQAYVGYLGALAQSGQGARIPGVVEARLVNDPTNEDLLLVAANVFLEQKNAAKTLEYANRCVDVMKSKAKPEGVADADWAKKKDAVTGRALWNAGMTYAAQTKHKETDQAFRAALPLIAGQTGLEAPALFYLGVANYNLGKASKNKALVTEAVRFSERAAKIPGPYQAPSDKNAKSMKLEFAIK